ncbi:hypothetical protein NO2_1512 [Candidatus Termititenax persephonae]|uniref:PsbP C-terminal domain-containing protein n=1 Tax=Candidatus Termititenax persephonae TaxID=2218525 RepID=A0A388TJK0_9BACT|nr:hypothetical protein NO2_1512 [Candidatus Termititenax persephonae]
MKKLTVLILPLLCVAMANWNGNRWEDGRYPFSLEVPGHWQAYMDNHRHRVYAGRGDEATEVYVDVWPANKRTAEDMAKAQLRAYDSWQYRAGAYLDGSERRGADSAFNVLYERAVLKRTTAKAVKVIVQEGYFVKGDNIYVLTVSTDSDSWPTVKKEVLQVWNSFKLR